MHSRRHRYLLVELPDAGFDLMRLDSRGIRVKSLRREGNEAILSTDHLSVPMLSNLLKDQAIRIISVSGTIKGLKRKGKAKSIF